MPSALRLSATCFGTLLVGLACAQTDIPRPSTTPVDEQERQAVYGYAAPSREAIQGAWEAGEAQRSAALWRSLSEARPADVNAQFNWFRSERNARLSSNNGRLNKADEEALNGIAQRINSAAPNSFEEHLSTYYLHFPDRSAFDELDQAARLAPDRPELLLPMLVRANANGDLAAMDQGARSLEAKGGMAPALDLVAQDLLASLDRNAIVFANGDMDVYPAIVQQRLHDQRRDVLVVDQRLLADAAYRQRIWREAKANGPVPAAGPAFAKALLTASQRPLFLALSLDRAWIDAFPGQLCAQGIAFRVGGSSGCDLRLAEQRWDQLHKTMDAGPLSRNYLLPGSLLLQRLRAQGTDERRIATVEAELRSMAARLGATQDLLKAGVLLH